MVEKDKGMKETGRILQKALWGLRIRRQRLRASLKFRWSVFTSRFRAPVVAEPLVQEGGSPLQGRFCQNPFKQIDLEESGVAYTCCSAWLPTPIGNLKQSSVMDMWNGETIKKIRESILDGSFRYCRHDRCPVIQNDSLPTLEQAAKDPLFTRIINEKRTTVERPPVFVNLVNDRSCNLYCPSCRTERINHQDGTKSQEIGRIQSRLLEPYLSEPNDLYFILSITGSGDPFASRVYRDLLYSLKGSDYPNMQIALQTNGVLLTPRNWQRMKSIHNNILSVIISFDAATEETYNITRRGGHWQTLLDNSARMGELHKEGEVRLLRFDFVVQKANFREMIAFVQLIKGIGADRVCFSQLFDWGTWPKDQFLDQCVWNEDHPLYEEFMQVMRDPLFDDPFVDLGNMSEFRTQAMEKTALRDARGN
ncbi:MAG: sulfatase maturation enzyme AslB (radical SAM superfamily) [Lysobacterales bacterium]